jgi:hypothetical protein
MTMSKMIPATLAAAALSIASAAFAGGVPNNGAAAAAKVAAEGAQPLASSSVARAAVLYSPFTGIIRSLNVTTVSTPDTGVYCIATTNRVRMKKFYNSVSVDWGWSGGNSLAAMTRDGADGFSICPAGQFEVRTFDLTGNPSTSVGFFFEVL